MKTLNKELAKDIFNEFVLSSKEMIIIRGGDGTDPIIPPPEKV